MALAINNVVEDAQTTATVSYNAGEGADRILVVAMSVTWETDNAITNVAYNGVNLTQAGTKSDPYAWCRTEVWYLLNPAAGANDLTYTVDDGTITSAIICYVSGADINAIGNTGNKNGDSAALNVDITPAVSGSLLLASLASNSDGTALAATGGSTEQGEIGPGGELQLMGLYSKTATSTASHNLACSGPNDGWAGFAIEIKAAAVTPTGQFMTTNTKYW